MATENDRHQKRNAEEALTKTEIDDKIIAQFRKTKARRLRNQSTEEKLIAEFRYKIEQSANQNNAAAVMSLYQELKDTNIPIPPYIYRVVLSICSKSNDINQLKEFQPQVYAIYKSLRAPKDGNSGKSPKKAINIIDESICTALIKIHSALEDFDICNEVIQDMEERFIAPKLRTLSPLLIALCKAGKMQQSTNIYKKLLEFHIEPSEVEYLAILQMYTKLQMKEEFMKFFYDYNDMILQPSKAGWSILQDWFQSDAAKEKGCTWTIQTGQVDEYGKCSITGNQLQSIELPQDIESALLDKVESLVTTNEKRLLQWQKYKQWLEIHGPFDIIIDAANVGYFNQNYDGGGFNYQQIAHMIKYYTKKKKKVLIVLHQRRTLENEVPPEDMAMVEFWRSTNCMYNCEAGNNDDWYWLYAAVKSGGRTLVVTNDEMRDHHFQMLDNKAFIRWKERHQVRYEILTFPSDILDPKDQDHLYLRYNARVKVIEPSIYSARPQRIGDVWHIPCNDKNVQDWLCIQLNVHTN